MRYHVRIIRVQTAEKSIRASDEEDAAKRVQAELDKPYGFIGMWTTKAVDLEIVEAQSALSATPGAASGAALLLSVKDPASQLGISQSSLRDMIRTGEIDHVRVGSRIYLSRPGLDRFIEVNTRSGYFE